MKRYAILCTLAVLAACDGAMQEDAPRVDETVIAADEGSEGPATPGTYQVTLADGSIGTSMLMEDGTYMNTFGDETETGTWSNQDGKACFDPEGESLPSRCYAIGGTAADGSFTATPDGGDPVRIRKLD